MSKIKNGTIEIIDGVMHVFGAGDMYGSVELEVMPTQDWMNYKHGDSVEYEIFDIGEKQYAKIITGQIQMSYEYYVDSIKSALLRVKMGSTDEEIMESAIKIAEAHKINS